MVPNHADMSLPTICTRRKIKDMKVVDLTDANKKALKKWHTRFPHWSKTRTTGLPCHEIPHRTPYLQNSGKGSQYPAARYTPRPAKPLIYTANSTTWVDIWISMRSEFSILSFEAEFRVRIREFCPDSYRGVEGFGLFTLYSILHTPYSILHIIPCIFYSFF